MKRAILVTIVLVIAIIAACGSVASKSDSGTDTPGAGGACKFDTGTFDNCKFAP